MRAFVGKRLFWVGACSRFRMGYNIISYLDFVYLYLSRVSVLGITYFSG